jgi:hypothetical protein
VSYTIIATGPKVPVPFEVRVNTATEAQLKLRPARELCGRAVVRDGAGHEISEAELGLLVLQECQVGRRQMPRIGR